MRGTQTWSKPGQCARLLEDGQKHGPRQLAGVGVLQRRVIAGEQTHSVAQRVCGAVREGRALAGRERAGAAGMVDERVEGDLAEAKHYAQRAQQRDLLIEPGRAGGQFFARRLVGRRRAAADRTDPEPREKEAVVAIGRHRLRAETRFVERGKEKAARAVAGKGPPGAVRSMRAWREAEQQHAGLFVAEGGNRLAPVIAVPVGAALGLGNLGAVAAQPWAACAGDDLAIQFRQRWRAAHALIVRRGLPSILVSVQSSFWTLEIEIYCAANAEC